MVFVYTDDACVTVSAYSSEMEVTEATLRKHEDVTGTNINQASVGLQLGSWRCRSVPFDSRSVPVLVRTARYTRSECW